MFIMLWNFFQVWSPEGGGLRKAELRTGGRAPASDRGRVRWPSGHLVQGIALFVVMMLLTTSLILRITSLLLKKCWRMVTIPRIWLRGLRSGLAQFVPKIGKLVEVENLFGDVNNLISRFSLKLKFYFPFMGTLTSTRP